MSVKLKNTRRDFIPHHCEIKASKAYRIQLAEHLIWEHWREKKKKKKV